MGLAWESGAYFPLGWVQILASGGVVEKRALGAHLARILLVTSAVALGNTEMETDEGGCQETFDTRGQGTPGSSRADVDESCAGSTVISSAVDVQEDSRCSWEFVEGGRKRRGTWRERRKRYSCAAQQGSRYRKVAVAAAWWERAKGWVGPGACHKFRRGWDPSNVGHRRAAFATLQGGTSS